MQDVRPASAALKGNNHPNLAMRSTYMATCYIFYIIATCIISCCFAESGQELLRSLKEGILSFLEPTTTPRGQIWIIECLF
jgi:hypothetical protein